MSIQRHKKKKHGTLNEEDSREEENKKDSNEDEVGIMVRDLSEQPDRLADWSIQNEESRLESTDMIEFDDSEDEDMKSENDKTSEEAPMKDPDKDDNQEKALVIRNDKQGKEDQNKNSSGTKNQNFQPEKDIREGCDKGGELNIKKTIKEIEDLRIENKRAKMINGFEIRRRMAKEEKVTWCEEKEWKKRIFLNYDERGKQSRNQRNLRPQTARSISTVMTSNHTVLIDTSTCSYVLFIALLLHYYFIVIPIWYLIMISE